MVQHADIDHTGLTGIGASTTELDYVQVTSNVSVTATTEGTANTVITSSAVVYDGSTEVEIEFRAPVGTPDGSADGRTMTYYLYEKVGAGAAASIGILGIQRGQSASFGNNQPLYLYRRMTPSAASIIYSIRASVSAGTGTVSMGAGGAGAFMPGSLRISLAA